MTWSQRLECAGVAALSIPWFVVGAAISFVGVTGLLIGGEFLRAAWAYRANRNG